MKYPIGGDTNPKGFANGVNGSATPIATKEIHVANNHLLGLLRKKGVRAVRITNTIRICVAIDSINHPVWKREFCARNIKSIIPKVAKSKIELNGPKKII